MSYELVPFGHAIEGAKPHMFAVWSGHYDSNKLACCILTFDKIIQAFRDSTDLEQRIQLASDLLEGTEWSVGHETSFDGG